MEVYQWSKEEKEIYPLKVKPSIIDLSEQTFITISGVGDPNQAEFSRKVSALYSVAYAIRFAAKKGIHFTGAFDFKVYPLEGYWTLQEEYQTESLTKEHFAYTIMIKQPSFVTEAVFEEALVMAKDKLPEDLLPQLQLKTLTEGLVAQILHKGPFDNEPATFEKLEQFLRKSGYQRTEKAHKEIYMNDFNKTAPENLKTILRVKVKTVE